MRLHDESCRPRKHAARSVQTDHPVATNAGFAQAARSIIRGAISHRICPRPQTRSELVQLSAKAVHHPTVRKEIAYV